MKALVLVLSLLLLAGNPVFAVNPIEENIDKYSAARDKQLKYYFKIFAQNKEQSIAWSNLGIIFYKKGLYTLSNVFFEEALRINPKNRAAKKYISDTKFLKFKDSPYYIDFDENTSSEEYNYYYNEGLNYFELAKQGKKSNYNKALRNFVKAASIVPSIQAYNLSALCRINRGDYNYAMYYYSKALEQNPHIGQIYANIGYSLYKLNFKHAAQDLFNIALDLDSENELAKKFLMD